jgi:hypothetical protein
MEINALASLTPEELRRCWAQVFKRPLPPSSRREFLLGSLAYELQAQAHGGLRATSHRALCNAVQEQTQTKAKRNLMGPIRPGTRLLRTWQGETHEVLALEKGFSYRGETYASLSKVAQAITGAHWSGPVFFGLKTPRPKKPKGPVEGAA